MRFPSKSRSHVILCLLCAFGSAAYARNKHPLPDRQDEIEVVAHLPLSGPEAVTRFVETRHYRHDYLYAEYNSQQHVALIDVTTADHPVLKAEIPLPAGTRDNLVSVIGNAALISANDITPGAMARKSTPQTQSYRIMSFLDPAHPVVKHEFADVTAVASDDKRGLIFIANKDGIWILQQKFAVSPEDEALQKSIERSIYDTP